AEARRAEPEQFPLLEQNAVGVLPRGFERVLAPAVERDAERDADGRAAAGTAAVLLADLGGHGWPVDRRVATGRRPPVDGGSRGRAHRAARGAAAVHRRLGVDLPAETPAGDHRRAGLD
ncbi:MAG: hypothetical protein ACK559_09905, partial [bacterium]